MSREAKNKAAYTLVDVNELPADVRQLVIEDALAGGGEYGVKVVEEVFNGPSRAQIFGVYHDVKKSNGQFHTRKNEGGLDVEIGNDASKWAEAKKELGISSTEIDDGEVTSVVEGDTRRAAALREAAEQRASAEAEAVRAMEDEQVRKVVEGDTEVSVPANTQARSQPNANIVDATVQTEHKSANKANKAR